MQIINLEKAIYLLERIYSVNLQEQRRMQFLAGIISESELESMNRVVTAHDVDVDAIGELPQVEVAAEMISQDPIAIAQLEKIATIAGVDSGLIESVEDEISDADIQKIANLIDYMIDGGGLEESEEHMEGSKEEKQSPVITAASIASVLPFVPGISGWFAQAADASGIPMMALGAGSVIAAAIVAALIVKVKDKLKNNS